MKAPTWLGNPAPYMDRILKYRETSGAIETATTATAIPAARQISLIMYISREAALLTWMRRSVSLQARWLLSQSRLPLTVFSQ